jgi:heme exporter protein D
MNLGPHASFILTAYAAAVIVIGGLIAWVVLDYRAQLRKLVDMEARGITRRSDRATPPSP